jgi:hypothetical protein
MIATPTQAIAAPIISDVSGTTPSKIKPQSNAITTNTNFTKSSKNEEEKSDQNFSYLNILVHLLLL